MASVAGLIGVPAFPAYLDLAEPDLTTVARELRTAGHEAAVVVPLLFTQAFHATVDVPGAVRGAVAETGLNLFTAEILRTGSDVADVLERAITGAGVAPDASVLLFAVGSSRPEANQAVADLAAAVGARRGTSARAAFGTMDPRPEAVLPDLPEPVAIVPLFLAEGLLLNPMRALAAERGWVMTEPLGALAAELVVRRYQEACEQQGGTRSPSENQIHPMTTAGRSHPVH